MSDAPQTSTNIARYKRLNKSIMRKLYMMYVLKMYKNHVRDTYYNVISWHLTSWYQYFKNELTLTKLNLFIPDGKCALKNLHESNYITR